jgi:hypothetical protein
MIRTLPLNVFKLVFFLTVLFLIPECLSAQKYYIIVGAYSNSSNAKNEVSRLKNDGFINSGFLAPVNAKLYKVFVDSLKTRELANAVLKNYAVRFKDAWIYDPSKPLTTNKKGLNQPSANEVNILKQQLDFYKRNLAKALDELDAAKNNSRTINKVNNEEKKITPSQVTSERSNNSSDFYNKFVKQESNEDDFIFFFENKIRENRMKSEPVAQKEQVQLKNKANDENFKISLPPRDSTVKKPAEEIVNNDFSLIDSQLVQIRKDNDKKIDQLNKTIDSLSKENLKGHFNFGNPKFSLDLGVMRTQVFTDLTQPILDYFSIETQKSSYNFYGFQLAGYYHFSQKWSTGINMENYYYNNTLYLFPTLNIKFSTQIINSPIKLSPIIGGGISCIVPTNDINSSKFADYIKVNGGIDFEMGIAKRFSFFATSYYNFCIPKNKENNLDLINYYNFIFGLRFNL